MPAFAIFDLDQTLLPYDTQGMFCNFVLHREGWRRGYLAFFAPLAVLKPVRLITTRGLKRIFLSYLWKMPRTRLDGYVSEFVETEVMPALYPEVLAELRRHQEAGHTTILNTASPEFYAGAIGRRLGFDHTIGTKILLRETQPLVPQIDGINNKYDEKLKAMRHLMPTELSLPLPGSWGYSDSHADLPLLRFVENPVCIHPDPILAQIAEKDAWRVMRPARPNSTRAAFARDCALQALGLWKRPAMPATDASSAA